jgi:DNA-directed RNA polymerase subunit K/omega
MDEANEIVEASADAPAVPSEPAPPIQSRFLFVDVAALRAKQLRRGARLRFDTDPGTPAPHTAERAAMEEVRRGLVYYAVPEWRGGRIEGQS